MRWIRSAVFLMALAAPTALALGIPLAAVAQETAFGGRTVTTVRVVDGQGNVLERNPPNLPLVAGKVYSTETERAAMKQLFASGLYANIRAVATPESGGVRVDFVVEQNYFVGVESVEGLKPPPSEAQALAAMGLDLGQTFTEESLQEALDRLKQTLSDDGFYQATLKVERDSDPQTRLVNITVLVDLGQRARLGKISVENQSRFSDHELVERTKLDPGDSVTSDRITNGMNRLRNYLTKNNFLTAQVNALRGDYDAKTNTLPLTIEVSAGPEVRVTVVGAHVGGGEIKKLVPVYQEGAVDPDLLEEGRRNIRDYFERKGYFNSQVDYKIQYQLEDEEQQNLETVVYQVTQGTKSRLVGVGFQGNHYFGDDLLASRLNIQPASFLSPGRYSPQLLSDDEESIRGIYLASGFRDATVKANVIDNYAGHKNDLFVRFEIHEGSQTRVASLQIEGNKAIPSDELLNVVGSTAGQPYSQANISNDQDNILALYYNRGFPDASFQYLVKKDGTDRVALTYQIDEGSQVRVNRVLLLGYQHTRPGVIRRRVEITPGQPLREADEVATQDRLYNLGIFNSVNIRQKNPSGSVPDKDVLIETREGNRYTIGYGGGVEVQRLASTTNATSTSWDVSPLGIFSLTKLNVTGRAQTASLKIRASTLQYRGLLSYQIPSLMTNPNFNLLLTGFAGKFRDVNTFTGTRYEASLQVVQDYSRSTTLLYRYTFRHVLVDANSLKIDPEQIPLYSQPTRVAGFGFTWIRDRRDNPGDASKGSLNTADFSFYSDSLGSSANFGRLFFQNSTYTSFGRVFVFARSVRFGLEEPFGVTTADNIPLPERFFAGGGTSLRGFGLNQAGPRDPVTGFPVGGLTELIFNQELRFPLRLPWVGNSLGGAIFYDGGNVFSQLSDITLSASPSSPTDLNYFSHTVGLGLRYATPVGPVRLDVGFQLNPAKFQVECTAGTAGCPTGEKLSQLSRFQFFFNIGSVF